MNKNFIIVVFVFLVMLTSVSAYSLNEEIVINALYTEEGVPFNANATIKIFLPNGTLDIEDNMTTLSTGNFYYSYTPSEVGVYNAVAEFYQGSSLQGTDSQTFEVFSSGFNFASCPTTSRQWSNFWLMIGIIMIFIVLGFVFSSAVTLGISGAILCIYSLIIAACLELVAYILIIFGLVICLYAAFLRPKN